MGRYAFSMWMGRENQGSPSGDSAFIGIDEKTDDPLEMAPGYVRAAYNCRISNLQGQTAGDIGTRGGLTQASSFNPVSFGAMYGKTYYVDPVTGIQWLAISVSNGVWFVSDGENSKFVAFPPGTLLNTQCDPVAAYGNIVQFFGPGKTPLIWSGNWFNPFSPLPNPDAGFSSIPQASTAEFAADRIVIPYNIDQVAVSNVGKVASYSPFTANFNINQGEGDPLVRVIEWYRGSTFFFKTRSIYLAQNFSGDLSQLILNRVARGIGLVGRKAVVLVGNDLFFMSPGGVYRINQIFENTPEARAVPISDPLKNTMKRINWAYGSGIIAQFRNDRVYFAVPLDTNKRNNALLVYNIIREAWESVDTFPNAPATFGIDDLAEAPYNGERRIFAMDYVNGVNYLMEDESSVDYFGNTNASTQILTYLLSRGFSGSGIWNNYRHLKLGLKTWNPSYSLNAYSSGPGAKQVLATNITKPRTKYYGFGIPDWNSTNANNDWGARDRKDYSVALPMAINTSGVILDQPTDFEDAYALRVPGRYAQLEITNTQGALRVTNIAFETWEDQRQDRRAV